eukprot:TRINITY_DN75453_c0_g1_i1.p1 TRINITY_DN75453_c0_g1~~TRINITY_DN75453_c0_g1_i1.p1  ORF type:complete len:675 (-),score=104.42 TRINITY_DN75453_c0_g1_i1:159-2153(-)
MAQRGCRGHFHPAGSHAVQPEQLDQKALRSLARFLQSEECAELTSTDRHVNFSQVAQRTVAERQVETKQALGHDGINLHALQDLHRFIRVEGCEIEGNTYAGQGSRRARGTSNLHQSQLVAPEALDIASLDSDVLDKLAHFLQSEGGNNSLAQDHVIAGQVAKKTCRASTAQGGSGISSTAGQVSACNESKSSAHKSLDQGVISGEASVRANQVVERMCRASCAQPLQAVGRITLEPEGTDPAALRNLSRFIQVAEGELPPARGLSSADSAEADSESYGECSECGLEDVHQVHSEVHDALIAKNAVGATLDDLNRFIQVEGGEFFYADSHVNSQQTVLSNLALVQHAEVPMPRVQSRLRTSMALAANPIGTTSNQLPNLLQHAETFSKKTTPRNQSAFVMSLPHTANPDIHNEHTKNLVSFGSVQSYPTRGIRQRMPSLDSKPQDTDALEDALPFSSAAPEASSAEGDPWSKALALHREQLEAAQSQILVPPGAEDYSLAARLGNERPDGGLAELSSAIRRQCSKALSNLDLGSAKGEALISPWSWLPDTALGLGSCCCAEELDASEKTMWIYEDYERSEWGETKAFARAATRSSFAAASMDGVVSVQCSVEAESEYSGALRNSWVEPSELPFTKIQTKIDAGLSGAGSESAECIDPFAAFQPL